MLVSMIYLIWFNRAITKDRLDLGVPMENYRQAIAEIKQRPTFKQLQRQYRLVSRWLMTIWLLLVVTLLIMGDQVSPWQSGLSWVAVIDAVLLWGFMMRTMWQQYVLSRAHTIKVRRLRGLIVLSRAASIGILLGFLPMTVTLVWLIPDMSWW